MAKLYVTEFRHGGATTLGGNVAQVSQEPALAEQAFTFTTTTQSAAFNANTRFIRVHTDSICSIAIGLNPTATTDSRRMVAGQTEYFAVPGGWKIAAVTNT